MKTWLQTWTKHIWWKRILDYYNTWFGNHGPCKSQRSSSRPSSPCRHQVDASRASQERHWMKPQLASIWPPCCPTCCQTASPWSSRISKRFARLKVLDVQHHGTTMRGCETTDHLCSCPRQSQLGKVIKNKQYMYNPHISRHILYLTHVFTQKVSLLAVFKNTLSKQTFFKIHLRSVHWHKPCFVQHSVERLQHCFGLIISHIELRYRQSDQSNAADSRPALDGVNWERIQSHHALDDILSKSHDKGWKWSRSSQWLIVDPSHNWPFFIPIRVFVWAAMSNL